MKCALLALALLLSGAVQATTPGPLDLIRCPESSELRLRHSLYSDHLFVDRVWSDGYVDAPLKIEYPRLSRCGHGQPLYWVDAAEVLQRWPPGQERPSNWPVTEVRNVEAPIYADFEEALDLGMARSRAEELDLRLRLWHGANHGHRHMVQMPKGFNPFAQAGPARDNLQQLVLLLDAEVEDERLLRIEVLRELGEFRRALGLLQRPVQPHNQARADWLRQLAKRGDHWVRPWPRP